MMIGALGFNLSTEDRSQIESILETMKINAVVETIDIRSTQLKSVLDNKDVVIAFGRFASNMGRKRATEKNITFIELPDIKKLYSESNGGDKGARESAYNSLISLKSAMDSGKIRIVDDRKVLESIREDSVPDLSPGRIEKLKQVIQETGKTDWVCLTKSGQSVRISLTPDVDSNFDINITFDELLAIKVAMDILQAKEVQFVSPNNQDSKGSSRKPSPDHSD